MPVDAGTKRSKTPFARKNASRARLRSAYQPRIPSAYIQVRTTSENAKPSPSSAEARLANAEAACSYGAAEGSDGPTPFTRA